MAQDCHRALRGAHHRGYRICGALFRGLWQTRRSDSVRADHGDHQPERLRHFGASPVSGETIGFTSCRRDIVQYPYGGVVLSSVGVLEMVSDGSGCVLHLLGRNGSAAAEYVATLFIIRCMLRHHGGCGLDTRPDVCGVLRDWQYMGALCGYDVCLGLSHIRIRKEFHLR